MEGICRKCLQSHMRHNLEELDVFLGGVAVLMSSRCPGGCAGTGRSGECNIINPANDLQLCEEALVTYVTKFVL